MRNLINILKRVIIFGSQRPNGEFGGSMLYLSLKYAMPYKEYVTLLTDIGVEEIDTLYTSILISNTPALMSWDTLR